MAIVQFVRLTCQQTEDLTGADEVYLNYNGARVFGPKKINNGESLNLNIVKSISGPTRVDLFDEDSLDADDFLGSISVSSGEVDQGLRSQVFSNDGARYTLFYQVLETIVAFHSLKAFEAENGAPGARLFQGPIRSSGFGWRLKSPRKDIVEEEFGDNVFQIASRRHGGLFVGVIAPLGGPIVQNYVESGFYNHTWEVESLGDGTSRIVSSLTGQVLDVSNESLKDGAQITQSAWRGSASQKWIL